MTTIADFIKHTAPNMSTLCWVFVLGSVFIQITPIKFNPLSMLFGWIGHLMTKNVEARICDLQYELKQLRTDEMEMSRWDILSFTTSVRKGIEHDYEAWTHCLDQLHKYEAYVKENDIKNGVIKHTARYLETQYMKHLEENDFEDVGDDEDGIIGIGRFDNKGNFTGKKF